MVAVLVRLAATTLIASTSSVAPPAVAAGDLVFASERSGTWQLWTVQPDGRRLQRLTRTSGADSEPAWSPDGARVAFVRDLGSWRRPIVVRDVAGGRERTVSWKRYAAVPEWSPDGRSIAFQVSRSFAADGSPDGRQVELWTVPAAGGTPRRVAKVTGYHEWDWSPDGGRIAFTTRAFGDLSIAVADLESGRRRVVAAGRQPVWSPDGARLAFVRGDDVFTARADGTDVRRVTRTARWEALPSWSPDGRLLAYVQDRPRGRTAVVVARADGSRARTVALLLAHPSRAVWSPEGRRIVFGTDTAEVLVARVDRRHATRLTGGLEPDWREP